MGWDAMGGGGGRGASAPAVGKLTAAALVSCTQPAAGSPPDTPSHGQPARHPLPCCPPPGACAAPVYAWRMRAGGSPASFRRGAATPSLPRKSITSTCRRSWKARRAPRAGGRVRPGGGEGGNEAEHDSRASACVRACARACAPCPSHINPRLPDPALCHPPTAPHTTRPTPCTPSHPRADTHLQGARAGHACGGEARQVAHLLLCPHLDHLARVALGVARKARVPHHIPARARA